MKYNIYKLPTGELILEDKNGVLYSLSQTEVSPLEEILEFLGQIDTNTKLD
jgi:hypothetical protein